MNTLTAEEILELRKIRKKATEETKEITKSIEEQEPDWWEIIYLLEKNENPNFPN